jgi:hypothetical protein
LARVIETDLGMEQAMSMLMTDGAGDDTALAAGNCGEELNRSSF